MNSPEPSTSHEDVEKTNNLKTHFKLPLYVVENHNEALPYIYRNIGSKHLPLKNLTLIHFDSHPDLLIPQTLLADDVHDPNKLFSCLSIENWILPAVYAGHISTVVWIKPSWANQISNQMTTFLVGKEVKTGQIKVTSEESYFIGELLYAQEFELDNAKSLNLIVYTLAINQLQSQDGVITASKKRKLTTSQTFLNYQEQPISDPLNFAQFTKHPYILDIDLDFFSTKNPFRELFPDEQFNILKQLYNFEIPLDTSHQSLLKCIQKREEQIKTLETIFSSLKSGSTIEDLSQTPRLELVKTLLQLIHQKGSTQDTIDYDLIHDAGCTCDDTELPHHVSTEEEISSLITTVHHFLRSLPKPTIITISRSSEDDYCPSDQVDSIQDQVLEILSELYDPLDVKLLYDQD